MITLTFVQFLEAIARSAEYLETTSEAERESLMGRQHLTLLSHQCVRELIGLNLPEIAFVRSGNKSIPKIASEQALRATRNTKSRWGLVCDAARDVKRMNENWDSLNQVVKNPSWGHAGIMTIGS